MKRRLGNILMILLLLPCLSGYCQTDENPLQKMQQEQSQIDSINTLSRKWWLRNYDTCRIFALKALSMAQAASYIRGQAEAQIYLGMYESQISGNKVSGVRFLNNAYRLSREVKDVSLQGFALTQQGNIYRNLGIFDSAKYFYDLSLTTLKDSTDSWQLSMLYRNLGKYYGLVSETKSEYDYLYRSLKIREKLDDNSMLLDALVCISIWHIKQFEFQNAQNYLDRAEKLVNKIEPTWATSDFMTQKALLLSRQGNFQEALKWYAEARNYYAHNSITSYVNLLISIGYVFEQMGSYEVSIKNYLEGLRIAEDKQMNNNRVRLLLGLGRSYHGLAKEKMAEDYARKGIDIAAQGKYYALEADGYNLYGNIKVGLKLLNEGIDLHKKALDIRTRINDRHGIAASLYNIGETLEFKGEYAEGLQYQLKSMEIDESILDPLGITISYAGLGRIYVKMGLLEQASFYLQKGEALARKIKAGSSLVEIYGIRRDMLEMQGKLNEALRYSRLYDQVKDSVFNYSQMNQIVSLQGFYDLDKKEKEIELLSRNKVIQQTEITLQKDQIKQQRLIIFITVIGIVLLTILAYTLLLYFRRKSRLNRELAAKQSEIEHKASELSEVNSTLISLNRNLAEKQEELEAQSEELRKGNEIISQLASNLEEKVQERTRELKQAYKELDTFFYRSSHDFRRPLTTFMGLAEVAKITVKDSNALSLFQNVKDTAVSLDRMLIKLQSISDVGSDQYVFKSVSVRNLLQNSVDNYKESIISSTIAVTIDCDPLLEIYSYPAFIKIIVDNLLENAIQFCAMDSPWVGLSALEVSGGIKIIVDDNGQGVDPKLQDRLFEMFFRGNDKSRGNGLGLYIVQKAAGKLNGTVEFISNFGSGTTVTIWIPKVSIP